MVPNLFLSSSAFTHQEGRVFRKELITAGTWHKGKDTWIVDEALLLHWVQTHKQQIANGLTVTLPAKHTDDPEKNRGFVLDLEVDVNEQGMPALFGTIEFAEGYEKLAKTVDVSVYAPNHYTDGKGNRYYRPIRHVALTTDPVVTGLGKFKPIVASFGEKVKMAKTMRLSMKGLAKRLGVNLAETDDDFDAEKAIIREWGKRGKSAVKEEKKDVKAEQDPPKTDPPKTEPAPIAAAHIDMLRENREGKLDRLVEKGKITKAVRDELHKQFANDDALALSFSQPDAFNSTITALEKNESVINFQQRTSTQLPKAEDNPLLRNANARRARAAAK